MNNFATSDFKRRQLYTWRSCEFTGVARWGTYPLAFQFLNVLTFRSYFIAAQNDIRLHVVAYPVKYRPNNEAYSFVTVIAW